MAKTNIKIIEVTPHHKQSRQRKESDVIRVAAYCRVSTLSEEQELSYETQCAYYRNLVDSDPALELVGVYGDRGCSGVMMKSRPQFLKMMQDCMDGKIDYVIVKSVSRFARNLADCLESVRKLKCMGIPVRFEREGIDTMDDRAEMILSMLAAIAQEESNSLSMNVRWAFEKRHENGIAARRVPYGYRKATPSQKNGSEWVIHRPEAKRVRLMFAMAGKGCRYKEILGALSALETKENQTTLWYHDKMHRMLRSEVYKGDVLTTKLYVVDYLSKKQRRNEGQRPQFYIEDHHPPIVDRSLFDRVQELLDTGALRHYAKH
ncbi:MAG: recombinase family protein [Eubacteriales bacterium]|jgi:DNA invertase Pin-like site-specific DNA recombinase|nr:recombinase family protein [Eubacteriales bacterium]